MTFYKDISIIISTGMSDLKEIDECYKIYKKFNKRHFALMHCVSNYPCKNSSLNLNVIEILRKRYKCEIGFSDHSNNNIAAIISSSFGVNLFEKHFTLDKTLPGNDHFHAMDTDDLKKFNKNIKTINTVLGNKTKTPISSELIARKNARRSIVVSKKIEKGNFFNEKFLTYKRPGTGISPKYWTEIIGKKAKRDLEQDHILMWDDIE